MSWRILLLALALTVASCGSRSGFSDEVPAAESKDTKVVNIYNWADYIAPDTTTAFTQQTGIKVVSSYYDSNETLETRVLTGHSGFDVVFTPQAYFERQIRSGAYQSLDKSQLPNLSNLDAAIMAQVASTDSGNVHGAVYLWGTFGLGFNEKMVADALPGAPTDTWALLFDPVYASKLATCGIHVYDDGPGLLKLVLIYMGRNPRNPNAEDFAAAEKALLAIRPYIRIIDNVAGIQALANGDICLSLGNNGDYVAARRRIQEAKHDISIRYVIPKEGSLLWFTMMAIPRDAPHAANAHRFIDYLMQPEAIAQVTNFTGYANANIAAGRFLKASVAADATIFPTTEERRRLVVDSEASADQARAITRLWQKFKTGQ